MISTLHEEWARGDRAERAAPTGEAELRGWVDAYAPRLYRAAAHLSSAQEAEDLCQEVFLIAARSRFEGRSSPYTWLSGILRNLIRAQRRKRARRRESRAALTLVDARTPERCAGVAQDRQRVREAITRLPEGQREVVVAFYIEELPVAEVARRLDLPVGTVKSRLFSARSALKAALEEGSDAL